MIYNPDVDDEVSESVNVDILDLLRAFFVALSKNCARLSGHPQALPLEPWRLREYLKYILIEFEIYIWHIFVM